MCQGIRRTVNSAEGVCLKAQISCRLRPVPGTLQYTFGVNARCLTCMRLPLLLAGYRAAADGADHLLHDCVTYIQLLLHHLVSSIKG